MKTLGAGAVVREDEALAEIVDLEAEVRLEREDLHDQEVFHQDV